ncbi:hypothetical protein [Rathayibacter iranicus]|uniref:ATP/GTP-binding protein n=2 Tax=Rathayibacter iranicus TaxID=59737 RepID=A0AAD1ABQ4_9MICO|nr:hypothetical protein [Rathayibacter iranicus]AZZ55338.1 hypothetical protein C7V51_05130 [Rathayibacter iranicus]MWV30936.1 hypothetical protein [Rathayibacter iranicus NCPPB 2253 = VKM Ac-1602]PPI48126.1 hypothetical protein C5E09_04200 [Rathayibacter iranicus]PPI61342.1 hypothetical protein C5E08_05110 [Rathayibacter iranicus]PPI72713.1 hypothetical protein C5E01_05515 [Rathayibacter iranicus]
MPRSNRPRGSRRSADDEQRDLSQMLAGRRHTEVQAGREWTVQPVSSARAVKNYLCPGCAMTIDVGQAHVVAWRADGALGDAASLAGRRHWHTRCWRIRGAR